jgi:hypothetical protein
MPTPDADRNLLLGILALQMDFITRDGLVAAMNAWVLDKGKPLGHVLRDQGQMTPARLQLLEALVGEHLQAHDNDPRQSLAAVTQDAVKQALARVDDPVLQQSVAALPSTVAYEPGSRDRYRLTRLHAKGGIGQV